MAHFAKIENNKVVSVIVIKNSDCSDLDFPESEPVGQAFIESLEMDGEWLQTSYNKNFRRNFAGIGMNYDSENDWFYSDKPTDGRDYTFDKNTASWQPTTKD